MTKSGKAEKDVSSSRKDGRRAAEAARRVEQADKKTGTPDVLHEITGFEHSTDARYRKDTCCVHALGLPPLAFLLSAFAAPPVNSHELS